jgi:branched chain amino acid efflux pump
VAPVSAVWAIVITVGVATIVLKGAGPVILGGRPLPERFAGVVRLLAPTLLAALIVVAVFGGDRQLVIDARVAGIAAAVVALLLRAPALVVVVVAATTTALVRAFA